MIKLFKENQYIFLVFILVIIGCIPLFSVFSKAEIHIFINKLNHPVFDFFFKYLTYLGDGIFVVTVGFIFLFVKYRYSLIIIFSYLFSSLIVQFLKRIVFSDLVRPIKYFKGIYDLHLVDGVEMYKVQSFPSGHATAAFAMFFCLVFFLHNKKHKILLFVCALFIAYSRMYLSQHFLIDVWTGSIIGVISSIIVYLYIGYQQSSWLDLSLLSNLKSKNVKE